MKNIRIALVLLPVIAFACKSRPEQEHIKTAAAASSVAAPASSNSSIDALAKAIAADVQTKEVLASKAATAATVATLDLSDRDGIEGLYMNDVVVAAADDGIAARAAAAVPTASAVPTAADKAAADKAAAEAKKVADAVARAPQMAARIMKELDGNVSYRLTQDEFLGILDKKKEAGDFTPAQLQTAIKNLTADFVKYSGTDQRMNIDELETFIRERAAEVLSVRTLNPTNDTDARAKAQLDEVLKKYDKDGDKKLNEAELAAMLADLQAIHDKNVGHTTGDATDFTDTDGVEGLYLNDIVEGTADDVFVGVAINADIIKGVRITEEGLKAAEGAKRAPQLAKRLMKELDITAVNFLTADQFLGLLDKKKEAGELTKDQLTTSIKNLKADFIKYAGTDLHMTVEELTTFLKDKADLVAVLRLVNHRSQTDVRAKASADAVLKAYDKNADAKLSIAEFAQLITDLKAIHAKNVGHKI